jgi:dCTP deaminase
VRNEKNREGVLRARSRFFIMKNLKSYNDRFQHWKLFAEFIFFIVLMQSHYVFMEIFFEIYFKYHRDKALLFLKKPADPAGIEPASLGSKPKRISSTPWILLFIFTSKDIKYFLPINYWMILSAAEMLRRLGQEDAPGKLVIRPYNRESQQPASYDLRAADETCLPCGTSTLLPTLEWVELPMDLAGTLRCRSTFGRRGVLLGGGFVDPGFRGQLTLCLTNMGKEEITVHKNDRVAQMILQEVRNPGTCYSGRYQDSLGVVEAK